jgi:hypothetical protein
LVPAFFLLYLPTDASGEIAAASLILGRLEGRPPPQLDLNNATPDFSNRSDDELRFCLEHSRWPESRELPAAPNEKSGGAQTQ